MKVRGDTSTPTSKGAPSSTILKEAGLRLSKGHLSNCYENIGLPKRTETAINSVTETNPRQKEEGNVGGHL